MTKEHRKVSTTPQDRQGVLALLQKGEISSCSLVPSGSNYTFLATLENDSGASFKAVYKPQDGEAPLWDFPPGTLYRREYVAYLVAEALGWHFVPPTVVREGPYGVGSVQLFVEHDHLCHYFTLRDQYLWDFQRICLFDWLANNADRKAGHCLLGLDGCIWSIDHGLTFHQVEKLRTVIWDFAGQPVESELLEDAKGLLNQLSSPSALLTELQELLYPAEIDALQQRLSLILTHPHFPDRSEGRVPWPWV